MSGSSLLAVGVVVASLAASGVARADTCELPPDPPGVETHARVEKVGPRFRATLEITSARSHGERVLEADTCEALRKSAAVVTAMAAAPPEEAKPDEPAPPPPPTSSEPADRDVAPRPAPRATRATARVEAVADSAMLPRLAAGGGIAIGIDALDRLHAELHGAIFAEQDGRLGGGDRGATFSLVSAGARACWALTNGIAIAPCVGLEIGRVGATGFGAQKVADGDAVIVAPEGAPTATIPLAGPVSLRAGVGALAPISRQSFVITARGTVHEVPGIAARGFVGPEVRF